MTEDPLQLLMRAPELAVLDALTATLDASARALTVAHDELYGLDCVDAPTEPSVEAALAAGVLGHIEALHRALRRYRTALQRRPDWERADAAPRHLF